ncbi:MAG: DUF748 domain-containing protein [Crocinitomicaceae bacterium]|nr:DUF748 domain-containing protein [Crocinitomicaceae bacterium]
MGIRNNKSRQTSLKDAKKPRKKRIFLWIVLSISVILIAVRIALPYVILKKINEKLEILPDYKCVVKDFSMHFLDLSITLKGVEMTKRNGKIKTPFFTSGDIHVTLESYKERTSKIVVEDCIMNLVRGKNEEESQLSIDEELKQIFKQMPLKPNIFIVKKADVHFIETYRGKPIDISVKNMHIDGRNIENQSKSKAKYPANLKIEGDFEGGKLTAAVKLNKQKKDPLINIVSSFTPIEVARVKNFLKVYANLDVKSGTLKASSIINVYAGRMDGFIDPIAENLVFQKKFENSDVKFGKKVKNRMLNAASKLLGKEEDKVIKTRVELHGTLGEVKVNVWDIVQDGLRASFLSGTKKED